MGCGASVRHRVASGRLSALALGVSALLVAGVASAADSLKGQVLGAGAPIAKSTVTLWATSAAAPKQLAQTRTGDDGRFQLRTDAARGKDTVLYLVAKGGQATANKGSADNPAIALMTVLGAKPPARVVINEMTTVASVWTHAQFLDGTAIKGHALGLKIATGNVPNFVDLATGGWGEAIQGPLNSSQTPTMASFATLADLLADCVTASGRRCVRQALRGGYAPDRHRPGRHADGGAVDRALSVVQARETLRAARPVLSGPAGQEPARDALQPVPLLRPQRLGSGSQV